MPRNDQTGPFGEGPMTGRGMGPCGGYEPEPYYGRPYRLGLAHRHGWRAWGRRAWRMPVQYDPREEKEILQDEQSWLQHRMDWIKGRIEQIDKPSEE
jgi:hypothetical protein